MPMLFDAGPAEVAEGEIRVVPVPAGVPPRRSLLVVGTSDGPRVFWNVCRHIPIPLDGGLGHLPDGLRCSTHGAVYRPEDGVCTDGPCRGEALERAPFRVGDDGRVWVEL